MEIDVSQAILEMTNLHRGGIPHEEDFLYFRRLRNIRPLFIDVGANAGQSAISFSMMCPDALTISFEPNPAYQPVLEHLRNHLLGAGQFEFRIVGAGSAAREVTLYIPVVNNMAYYQEASVDMSQFDKPWVSERLRSYGNDVRFEQIIIQVHPLDAYCLSPTIVKIDAEGGEMDALKGMEETINKHRPIFLIENNDYGQVTEYLERFGYSAFRYDARSDQLLPMTGATTNCFYLRPEQQIA